MNLKLHIISFDIPYPPDYGGVIDVFYKIRNLHRLGVEIILHCFQYGNRTPQDELNQYCNKVYYYKRNVGLKGLSIHLPYIVSSRKCNELLQNLLMDNYPILFEGIHTTYYLNSPLLQGRFKLVRNHNIEANYYYYLSHYTQSFFKKKYYQWESKRLYQYEKKLEGFSFLLPISERETAHFKKYYSPNEVIHVPAFHEFEKVVSKAGRGNYCLFHGNLSVAENEKSAIYLIETIFNDLEIHLIIAGKNPSQKLCDLANDKIKIINNPSKIEMDELIQNAQINVLPNFQQTGIKLKLLHSLFAGRFCITNDDKLEKSLANETIFAKDSMEFKNRIIYLFNEDFTEEHIEKRKSNLKQFDNVTNAQLITKLLQAEF